MGKNAALKSPQQTKLDEFLFEKKAIEGAIAKREHIFELRIHEKILGFISLYDLKDYASANVSLAEKMQIRNIDQNNFQSVFEHPLFQRRKPQIISPIEENISVEEQQYFTLNNGQKSGPYKKADIENFINKKEMIMNDMISLNAGTTWIKLYTVPGFERRALRPASELPALPDEDHLKQGPADSRINDDVIDATSSLAYLGNLKKGKVFNQDIEQMDQDEAIKQRSANGNYKWLFIISFIGVIYFIYNIVNTLKSPLGNSNTQTNTLGEQVEKLTPTDVDPNAALHGNNNRMNTSRRQNNDKMQTRQLNPVRPTYNNANRGQQKSFRDANPNAFHEPNEPTYYFDNAAPMELDPVREQVSKETFDAPAEQAPPPADDALFNQESNN